MQQLSNDTGSWNLIDSPLRSPLFYNSSTYESAPHGSAAINDLNAPITSLTGLPSVTLEASSGNYWALVLMFFPLLTIFGNVLVVISVYREKSLHTVTNYFVVSLAISDITVAAVVMPFAIYLEFNRVWELSERLCDFWVAADCMACTASILNLVAIAVDRYIAVTKPLQYARHKNSNRVTIMIVIVWLISFVIAVPIVSGINKSDVPEYPRVPEQCAFFNNKFLIVSSLGSFFIPCIIIFAIYYRIFMVIMSQARKNRKQLRPKAMIKSAAALHRNNADNLITNFYHERQSIASPASAGAEKTSLTSPVDDANEIQLVNYNHRSDAERHGDSTVKLSAPMPSPALRSSINVTSSSGDPMDDDERDDAALYMPHEQVNGNNFPDAHPQIEILSSAIHPSHAVDAHTNTRSSQTETDHQCLFPAKRVKIRLKLKSNATNKRGASTTATVAAPTTNVKVAKRKAYSRMKKERKATQTLIIVLICFLVCWLPFFVLNNLVNTFVKLSKKSSTLLITDLTLSLCVWLGYINSFLNPIIYTIFNMEFRKAFAKILFSPCRPTRRR